MEFLQALEEAQKLGVTKDEFTAIWLMEAKMKGQIPADMNHMDLISRTGSTIQQNLQEICKDMSDSIEKLQLQVQDLSKQIQRNQREFLEETENKQTKMTNELERHFHLTSVHVTSSLELQKTELKSFFTQELELIQQNLERKLSRPGDLWESEMSVVNHSTPKTGEISPIAMVIQSDTTDESASVEELPAEFSTQSVAPKEQSGEQMRQQNETTSGSAPVRELPPGFSTQLVAPKEQQGQSGEQMAQRNETAGKSAPVGELPTGSSTQKQELKGPFVQQRQYAKISKFWNGQQKQRQNTQGTLKAFHQGPQHHLVQQPLQGNQQSEAQAACVAEQSGVTPCHPAHIPQQPAAFLTLLHQHLVEHQAHVHHQSCTPSCTPSVVTTSSKIHQMSLPPPAHVQKPFVPPPDHYHQNANPQLQFKPFPPEERENLPTKLLKEHLEHVQKVRQPENKSQKRETASSNSPEEDVDERTAVHSSASEREDSDKISTSTTPRSSSTTSSADSESSDTEECTNTLEIWEIKNTDPELGGYSSQCCTQSKSCNAKLQIWFDDNDQLKVQVLVSRGELADECAWPITISCTGQIFNSNSKAYTKIWELKSTKCAKPDHPVQSLSFTPSVCLCSKRGDYPDVTYDILFKKGYVGVNNSIKFIWTFKIMRTDPEHLN